MPPSTTPPQSPINSLIALKSQYEQALTAANTKASHLREKLSHVNALLLNQLVPSYGVAPLQIGLKSAEPALDGITQADRISLSPAIAKAPASETPKTTASNRKAKATPKPTPASSKRSPRPLLPAYEGLTRLEAIAQVLQATPGQDVTTDQISEGLFGKLSAADHKAERKSLNTQLYKGQSQKRWQKGTAPATFLIGKPTASKGTQTTSTATAKAPKQPKPKAPIAKAPAKAKAEKAPAQRKSLPLLPAYAQLTKREAIAQVLGQHPGEMLHHDTIIQTLYGDLSPEALREERVRIKTALFTGVKDGKWQKASVPSSYFLEDTATGAKPRSLGRKPKEPIT
ncbi:MAG: hypothetical protein WCA35_17445, partial [Kovacikia sp.]